MFSQSFYYVFSIFLITMLYFMYTWQRGSHVLQASFTVNSLFSLLYRSVFVLCLFLPFYEAPLIVGLNLGANGCLFRKSFLVLTPCMVLTVVISNSFQIKKIWIWCFCWLIDMDSNPFLYMCASSFFSTIKVTVLSPLCMFGIFVKSELVTTLCD